MSDLDPCPWCRTTRLHLDCFGIKCGPGGDEQPTDWRVMHDEGQEPKCEAWGPECDTREQAIAAWNRRAPSAEETRLRAEVASLRATLGQQPAADGAEPIGCPLPGACGAVRAHAAAFRAGAAEMRERAAEQVDCGCSWRADALAATNKGERFVACGNDPCGAIEARAIRALPLPATPPEGEG